MPGAPIIRLSGVVPADPAHEAEFNDWYNRYHVPEVCSRIPGIHAGTRYRLVSPKDVEPCYIVVYELEEGRLTAVNDYLAKQQRGEEPPFTPGPPFKAYFTHTYQRIMSYERR
ncbi:MAG: hypothetical protein HYX97_00600 [Chloroflexi bacterium]|nr:hypothetical protein [Chloroflexota bacterium]